MHSSITLLYLSLLHVHHASFYMRGAFQLVDLVCGTRAIRVRMFDLTCDSSSKTVIDLLWRALAIIGDLVVHPSMYATIYISKDVVGSSLPSDHISSAELNLALLMTREFLFGEPIL